MATWSRRLSAAQAKQPGTARRALPTLPENLPEGILADDQAALRALAGLAKDRPEFRSRVVVRRGDEDDFTEIEVEVAHGESGPTFEVLEDAPATDVAGAESAGAVVSAGRGEAGDTAEAEEAEEGGEEGVEGGRVLEMLADTLVVTSDLVAIFASVGAEAIWANDAFATTIPVREDDHIWLIELFDDWSKGHYEVNVLPSLVQHGRWNGHLVLLPTPEDEGLPVVASFVAHRDRQGEIEAVSMVARDLRPLQAGSDRVRAAGTRLAGLAERPHDILVVVDGDGAVRYASPATTSMLGMDDGALAGTKLADLFDPAADPVDLRALSEPGADGVPPALDLRLRAIDGSWRILEVLSSDLLDNPAIDGVVLTGRDVTERVEAVQRLADRAYTDPLTLLPNRMRLLDRVGGALADASDHSVVALVFDVDHFGAFNQRHGHAAGDELLRQVASRLADDTRPQDIVARVTVDTFALVMSGVTDLDSALVTADRIKNRLTEPYRIGTEHLEVTISVGVAVAREGQSAHDLLAEADDAVGIAEEHGGDRIELMTGELRGSSVGRRKVEEVLRRAIDASDGVEVHYQPIYALDTVTVAAAEALLRVHDDEGALLSPASFLEAAESSGLIRPLGSQVLQMTCQQLAQWRSEGSPEAPPVLSVNVSPRQLTDPQFPALVGDAIEAAGIVPACLQLEITESSMLGGRGVVDDAVNAVRGMGVAIGLDDFGAGQGSLGYLKRFPLDFVKLDRELISGLGQDDDDTAIVRATVDLAHSLGLIVVAVGVETEDQLDILQFLGVDQAQGFWYSPAVPAADFLSRVRARAG